jgi:hypothetical protein
MTDTTQESYNKYTTFPNIPYNIISYLMDNNETVWKLLYYTDNNAWNKPALSRTQKASLVYNGSPNMFDYRVFMSTNLEDGWTAEAAILRIPTLELLPTNYVYGNATIGLEVYCHSKIESLNNYTTRTDTIIQSLLQTLNGAEISGVGRLFFDARASGRCRMVSIGALPYRGKALMMVNTQLG